jgi:hypothetical protein
MFRIVVDPALLFPPIDGAVSAADWVLKIRRWERFVTHEAMIASCPANLAARAVASWWEQRDAIVAALRLEGGPLEHGELARVVDEISARLAISALASGDEALFTSVSASPDYVAAAFTSAERYQFREHLGDLALQRRAHQCGAVVATEQRSWADDASSSIVVEGELALWVAGGLEQQLDANSSSIREHLRACCEPADIFASLLQHPVELLAHPRLAVEAYAASELGVDPRAMRFRFGSGFVASLQAMHYEHEPGRASACWRTMALVASGRVSGGGLNAHRVLQGAGAGARPVKDDSGRVLMRGYLANNSPAAGRIHWWSGEEPEFESVGPEDDIPT